MAARKHGGSFLKHFSQLGETMVRDAKQHRAVVATVSSLIALLVVGIIVLVVVLYLRKKHDKVLQHAADDRLQTAQTTAVKTKVAANMAQSAAAAAVGHAAAGGAAAAGKKKRTTTPTTMADPTREHFMADDEDAEAKAVDLHIQQAGDLTAVDNLAESKWGVREYEEADELLVHQDASARRLRETLKGKKFDREQDLKTHRKGHGITEKSCMTENWDMSNHHAFGVYRDPEYNNDKQALRMHGDDGFATWSDRVPNIDSRHSYVSRNGQSFAESTAAQKEIFGCTNTTMANFNPLATRMCADCCEQRVYGCADPTAVNYDSRVNSSMPQMCRYRMRRVGCTDPSNPAFDPTATVSDASRCAPAQWGCVDPFAPNFDPKATLPGYCQPIEIGCMDKDAENYDAEATIGRPTNCIFPGTERGCTNPYANNWNPNATEDDGSCVRRGCTDPRALNFDMDVALEPSDSTTCMYSLRKAVEETKPSTRYVRADEFFEPRDMPLKPCAM